MVAVIEPVSMKVSVAARDLQTGRLRSQHGEWFAIFVERYLLERRDKPHTICLRASCKSRVRTFEPVGRGYSPGGAAFGELQRG